MHLNASRLFIYLFILYYFSLPSKAWIIFHPPRPLTTCCFKAGNKTLLCRSTKIISDSMVWWSSVSVPALKVTIIPVITRTKIPKCFIPYTPQRMGVSCVMIHMLSFYSSTRLTSLSLSFLNLIKIQLFYVHRETFLRWKVTAFPPTPWNPFRNEYKIMNLLF